MHHASVVPEPNTYHRVLRRTDRDPRYSHQMRFASYDVNLRAVAVELGGVTAPTLFFPKGKEKAADRALRVGWVDVTREWHEYLGNKLPPERELELNRELDRVLSLDWNALKGWAKERDLDCSGKRPDVEHRVREWLHHRFLNG